MKNLNEFGVQEMDAKEIRKTNGGSASTLTKWLGKRFAPAAVAIWIAENWSDVKSGVVDGWNENH